MQSDFCVNLTQLGSSEEGALDEEMPLRDPAIRHFSPLVINGQVPAHDGWFHPWAAGPGFYKKVG